LDASREQKAVLEQLKIGGLESTLYAEPSIMRDVRAIFLSGFRMSS
jgi:hypothetical protein